jgi:hypothetical protein
MHFYLGFWVPFAFWEACFHKVKGREIHKRSHKDLNTADDKVGTDRELLCNH